METKITVVVIVALPCRTLSPDNEGMETFGCHLERFSHQIAGHSAPTMRGWKLADASHTCVAEFAGHSAPTMRGWKLRCRGNRQACPIHRRTLSPDNEGMETSTLPPHGEERRRCRTLSPDNEGMETRRRCPTPGGWGSAGHSAPTMRGWKLIQFHDTLRSQNPAGHSAPTMRGWKPG